MEVGKWTLEVGKWKSETRSGMTPIGHGRILASLRYFTPTTSLPSSGSTPSLPKEALVEPNKRVASLTRETDDAGPALKRAKKNYATYSPEDRSKIGRHILSRGSFEDRTICC